MKRLKSHMDFCVHRDSRVLNCLTALSFFSSNSAKSVNANAENSKQSHETRAGVRMAVQLSVRSALGSPLFQNT